MVPLTHMCGDHSLCSDEWCYALKAKKNGKEYHEPITNFVKGMHDREIKQVGNIIEKYTSVERMREMQHNKDTQICESANYMLTGLFAPKDKNFSRTKSFDYRKCHVMCLHNDGHYFFTPTCLSC